MMLTQKGEGAFIYKGKVSEFEWSLKIEKPSDPYSLKV